MSNNIYISKKCNINEITIIASTLIIKADNDIECDAVQCEYLANFNILTLLGLRLKVYHFLQCIQTYTE